MEPSFINRTKAFGNGLKHLGHICAVSAGYTTLAAITLSDPNGGLKILDYGISKSTKLADSAASEFHFAVTGEKLSIPGLEGKL